MKFRMWLPLEHDWEEAKAWTGTENLEYHEFKEQAEKSKEILNRKGMDMDIFPIPIAAMKSAMNDAGLKYDTPKRAAASIQVVMDSPFPVFEMELQKMADETNFT